MKNSMHPVVAKILALALFLSPLQSYSAVPEEQAARLGKDLTPMGAEMAGNADKSIPAWTGGITTPPAGYKVGMHHLDPFADDKILYTITNENLDKYKDKLTPGTLAIFKTYPTFKMNVYESRRTASYPDYVYKATRANATTAESIENGYAVDKSIIGIPFPIPSTAYQVIWNHILRYRGKTLRRNVLEAVVFGNGTSFLINFTDQIIFSYSLPDATLAKLKNILWYYKQMFTAPARYAGTTILVHETVNQIKEPRQSWLYTPGQRRVRRAPFVGFDFPSTTTDGNRLIEEFDMFTGSTERFTWELLGKKEMIIPYNCYKLCDPKLKYKDILTPGHINADLPRYELHRVWVLEAKLRDGWKHLYPRRTFYIDEDSWQTIIIDDYGPNGDLVRVSVGYPINYYEVPTLWTVAEVHHDLVNHRYVVLGLNNEDKPVDFNLHLSKGDFSPAGLGRDGMR